MQKITKKQFESLRDKLNQLMIYYDSISAEEREVLRSSLLIVERTEELEEKAQKQRQAERFDPRYPNRGKPWLDEDITVIHDLIDDIPDEEIINHVTWLAKKFGRTPFSVALKIVHLGRCDEDWAEPFRHQFS